MIFLRVFENQENIINNKLGNLIVNNKVKVDLNNDHNDNKKGDSHKNPCIDFLGQLGINNKGVKW